MAGRQVTQKPGQCQTGVDDVLHDQHVAPLERAPYAQDASLLRGAVPAVVCLPTSTAEVQACYTYNPRTLSGESGPERGQKWTKKA